MTASVIIKAADGTSLAEGKVLSFVFDKDLYTPYTTLRARVRAVRNSYEDAAEVILLINGNMIHHGLVDNIRWERADGEMFMNVSSRGFTSLLTQNQIEPGLKSHMSFNALMENFYSLPYVTHEDNSDDSSYIYVRPNTSMWDAASNLAYKLLGTYPYIRGTNKVMISSAVSPAVFDLRGEKLLSIGTELTDSRLASGYHMANMGGTYGEFDLADTDAEALKIVRHKYFDLDMRFLYDPPEALAYRDKYDFRGQKRLFCSYAGYRGEDLSDLVSFGSVSSERVGSVSIRGTGRGVVTEIGVYRDKFPR